MISKKEIVRGMDSLDERITDMSYDINTLSKNYEELLARVNSLAGQRNKVGRPKKLEVKEVKKVGRPRKNVQRVDFAKKK